MIETGINLYYINIMDYKTILILFLLLIIGVLLLYIYELRYELTTEKNDNILSIEELLNNDLTHKSEMIKEIKTLKRLLKPKPYNTRKP